MKDSISIRQLSILCCIMLFSMKILTFPSVLFQDYGWGALVILFVGVFVDLFVLYLILKIKGKNSKFSFNEILIKNFGKIISKIIIMLFFIFFILKIIYIFDEGFVYLKSTLYDEASIVLFGICVLPVCNNLFLHGIRSMSRTLEFIFIFIVFGVISCIVLAFVAQSNIIVLPFFDKGISAFFSSLFSRSMWFGDYLFVFFIIDKFEIKKGSIKKIFTYLIIAIFILFLFYFAYFKLYQTTSFLHAFAIADLIQFATKVGGIGKIDILASLTYMLILFFPISTLMYTSTSCLNCLYQKNSFNTFLVNFLIFLFCGIIITNVGICCDVMSIYFPYLAVSLILLFPVITYLFSYFKKVSKRGKYGKI